MKLREWDLLMVLVYSQILDSCNGESSSMLLFRMRKTSVHYKNNMAKDYDMDSDPLNSFSSSQDAMQALCDDVRNAKKFFNLKNRWHEVNHRPPNSLGSRPQDDRPVNSAHSELKIQECRTIQRWGTTTLKCLPCKRLDTENAQFFVAFGRVNEFMYLLEPSQNKRNVIKFRLTSLIEPSAVLQNDPSFLYFHSQFRKSKSKMERICKAIKEDRIRLCSAVFDALARENLRSTNYVRSREHHCIRCVAKGKNLKVTANFMPCEIIIERSSSNKTSSSEKIFLLADSREQGAAFVLRYAETNADEDDELPILRLHARVAKIGVFFHPVDGEKIGTTGTEHVDNLKLPIFKKKRNRRGRKSKSLPAIPHTYEEHLDPSGASTSARGMPEVTSDPITTTARILKSKKKSLLKILSEQ